MAASAYGLSPILSRIGAKALLFLLGVACCGFATGQLMAADPPPPKPSPTLARASGVSVAARYRTCVLFGSQGRFHQKRYFAASSRVACAG